MGNILIVLGFILIVSSLILWLFYRKKPLTYKPPKISGSAETRTSHTAYSTQSAAPLTMPTIEDTDEATYDEATETLTMQAYEDLYEEATATLTQAGVEFDASGYYEAETAPLKQDGPAHDASRDYASETVPLIQSFKPHGLSQDDETEAL